MKSKVLILGGAGFIGSHLCDALIKDFSLVVVDNLSLGRLENINHLLDKKNFKFLNVDINSTDFENIFLDNNFTTVYHLAANSDIAISYSNPDIDFYNTFKTTYSTLKMMLKYGCKEIVFASSSAIYGETVGDINEDYGPLFPKSHYGAAKLASEAFISSFRNYKIKSWIIRFPNVIGERCTHGVIYDFIKKIKNNPNILKVLGDGEQNKPYLYVKDLVDAIIHIKNNCDEELNYYNVGVNSKTKVKKIVKILLDKIENNHIKVDYEGGKKGWIGDVVEFQYNLEKTGRIGWNASMSSDEAVEKSIIKALDNWMQ